MSTYRHARRTSRNNGASGKKDMTLRANAWGSKHKKSVARLKAKHVEGTPCWWCGEPMYLSQGLQGDHSISRAKGGTETDRLLHGPCNRERGDGSLDHMRPSVTGKPLALSKGDRSEWVLLEW